MLNRPWLSAVSTLALVLASEAAWAQNTVPPVSTVAMRRVALQAINAQGASASDDGLTYAERAQRLYLKTEIAKVSSEKPGDLGAIVSKINQQLADVATKRNEIVQMQRGLQLAGAAVSDFSTLSQVPLPTAMVSTVLDIGLSSGIDDLDDRVRFVTGQVLQAGLQELRQSRRSEYDKLGSATPAERYRILFGKDGGGGLFDETSLGGGAPAELRAAVAYEASLDLDRRLRETSRLSIRDIETLNAKARQMSGQLEATRQSVAQTQEGHRRLGEAIGILNAQTQSNTARLDVVEEYVWKNLSDGEKAKALREGKFTVLISDPALRKKYIEDLEFVSNLKDYRAGLSTAKQVASDLSSVATILGAPPTVQEAISFASQGMDVADAVLRMSTGSPLEVVGGLGALSRTFGGARPDPTGAALKALQQQLTAMRQEMYQYHVQTMGALGQMSERIDKGFKNVETLQQVTIAQVAYNTRAINDLLRYDVDLCDDVANAWTDGSATLDERADTINTNATLIRAVDGCLRGTVATFRLAKRPLDPSRGYRIELSSMFLPAGLAGVPAPEVVTAVQQIRQFQDETYLPTLAYSRRTATRLTPTGCDGEQLLFLSLLPAGGRAGAAREEFRRLVASCATKRPTYRASAIPGRPFVPVDVTPLLREPVSATALLRTAPAIYRASSLYEFAGGPAGTAPILKFSAVLRSRDRSSSTSLSMLEQVKPVLDIAVVQHNMLSGDFLLEQIATDLEAGLSADGNRDLTAMDDARLKPSTVASKILCAAEALDPKDAVSVEYFNALCILKANPFLNYNFTRYWLKSRLKQGEVAFYAAGYHLTTLPEMANAFVKPMPLQRPEGGWELHLPVPNANPVALKLPPWASMISDRQAYPGDFRPGQVAGDYYPDLLVLRANVEDLIAEYRASETFSKAQKKIAYAAIVITARSQSSVPTASDH